MAGPWEQYQQSTTAPSGPWVQYQQPSTPAASAETIPGQRSTSQAVMK